MITDNSFDFAFRFFRSSCKRIERSQRSFLLFQNFTSKYCTIICQTHRLFTLKKLSRFLSSCLLSFHLLSTMHHHADWWNADPKRIPRERIYCRIYITIDLWRFSFYGILDDRTDHELEKRRILMEYRDDVFHTMDRVPRFAGD